jgi:hypothetical protein
VSSVQGSGKVTIELPKWQLQRFQRVRSANAVASFNPFDFLPFRQSAFCSKHPSFDEHDDQSGHKAASTPIRREHLPALGSLPQPAFSITPAHATSRRVKHTHNRPAMVEDKCEVSHLPITIMLLTLLQVYRTGIGRRLNTCDR